MDAQGRMVCKLKVNTRSSGWQKTLTKLIKRVKGVAFNIDAEEGVAHIAGGTNPNKLLHNIEKCKKHAKLVRAECESRFSCDYGYDDCMYGYGYGYGHGYSPCYYDHYIPGRLSYHSPYHPDYDYPYYGYGDLWYTPMAPQCLPPL